MTRYIDAEKLAQKVLELEDQLTPRKTFEAEVQYRFLLNVITPMIATAPTEDVVSVADGPITAETEEDAEEENVETSRFYTGRDGLIHARWIGTEYDGYADGNPVYDTFECSHCGEEHQGEVDTLTNYCPHCGAKMDADE